MKLSEIQTKTVIGSDIQKITQLIHDCAQPWLSASRNGKLIVYRGVSSYYDSSYVQTTRSDRRPKDTDPDRHRAFNAAIKAAGGIANRSNSLFVSGHYDTADDYGTAYVVIPLGEFHYTWSPTWRDWATEVWLSDLAVMLNPDSVMRNASEDRIIQFESERDQSEWGDSRKFLEWLYPQTKEMLQNSANYDRTKIPLTIDKNLSKAIKSQHEIMLQSEKVLYISKATYKEVRKLL